MRILLLSLLLSASLGLRATEPVAVIPIKIVNEHIFFELKVNDSEPLSFVFDTGAAGNVMSDKTADKLGLERTGKQYVQGASGVTSIESSTNHGVSIEDITIKGIDFMVMDLDHLGDEDATVDGIIGATILYRYVVELNYDEMEIRLYQRKGYTPLEGWTKQRISLQGFRIPIVQATINLPNGESLTGPYLVDTGAATTVKFNTPFVNGNGLIDKMGKHYAYSSRTLSKTATDEVSRLPSYEVFGHTFKDISVRLSQGTQGVSAMTQVDGILGLSILKRFNTVYDYYNQAMYLSPSRHYKEHFRFNHDGMKIEKQDGAFKVTAVFPDSPAEAAGIQAGDVIVSIDNKRDFTRHEFHNYFEEIKVKVLVKLNRDGKSLTVKLTPKSML